MGEKDSEFKQDMETLFCPDGKPMEFSIFHGHKMLNIMLERTLWDIEKGGGEFVGFDLQDNNQINLAMRNYKPDPKNPAEENLYVFDINYIKRCKNKKMRLDLQAWRLHPKKVSQYDCPWMDRLLHTKRCRHMQTASDVLRVLKTHGKKKQALADLSGRELMLTESQTHGMDKLLHTKRCGHMQTASDVLRVLKTHGKKKTNKKKQALPDFSGRKLMLTESQNHRCSYQLA